MSQIESLTVPPVGKRTREVPGRGTRRVSSRASNGNSTRRLTLEEFLKLPETEPASEFIDGRIIQKVSPKAKHSLLQGEITERINRRTKRRRIGLAFVELRCNFAGRSLVFDVSYLRWDRIALDENGEPIDDVFLHPDFGVEVVSPDQAESVLAEKLTFAVRHGVKLGWLVNPYTRKVKVFQPGKSPQILAGKDVLSGGPLMGGFRCTVDQLFGWLKIS